MAKLNYLNVGCGHKIHKDWINVDFIQGIPEVIEHNILEGLPFEDNTLDVVYHSQVLEHFPKAKGKEFMQECYRVLKPGGRIRVVLPDLEGLIKEYVQNLETCKTAETPKSAENYDWSLIELMDQVVRNQTGGEMAEFLGRDTLIDENYLYERIGMKGKYLRGALLKKKQQQLPTGLGIRAFVSKFMPWNWRTSLRDLLMTSDEKHHLAIGKFREGGEIHYWMYDEYSLSKLLKELGFSSIERMTPNDSKIPDWPSFKLDVNDDGVLDPDSLFIEAVK